MRIYMRRRSGYRNVRGGIIIQLQRAIATGNPTPLSIDGVFGGQTEMALRAWQSRQGMPVTSMVDEITWTTATAQELPNYFRRCLAITAAFEGHGYTFAAGNWDNAYLTWGVVGFTLKHGNFGKVIRTIEDRHPGLIASTIGTGKSKELLEIIETSASRKKAWGEEISVLPKKYRIRADWEDAFESLGHRREVREIQDELARKVYWKKAVADLKKFGEPTESDAALFFDTAVQNGGVNAEKAVLIQKALSANPGAKGRNRLMLLATAIADGSNPKYRDDVFSRRSAIASGKGRVHGADYQIEDWMVDYQPVQASDLNP